MINFSFREAGIAKWIFHFLGFLLESGWVFSLEEQVGLLEEMVKEMENSKETVV